MNLNLKSNVKDEMTPQDISDMTRASVMKDVFNQIGQEDGSYKVQGVAAPYRGGMQLGFQDPNQLITPWDAYGGSAYQLGFLAQIRYTHDIVASIMESRVASIGSMEFDVVPRTKSPTKNQVKAAEAVKHLLTNMPGMSLSNFVARTYDRCFTYGFSAYELWIPELGEHAYKLHLLEIPANQILQWSSDETRTELLGVEINSGDKLTSLPAYKISWFGEESFVGNFWGTSGLRKVLVPFQAQSTDLKNYLELRRLAQGILYFKENATGDNIASYSVIKNFLSNYYAGRISPLILNEGLDIDHLNASDPTLSNYETMLSYFDTKIREAMNDSISNLGVTGSGSLALGKEVNGNEKEQFVAAVNYFLKTINGHASRNTRLLETLTKICGYDIVDAPEIVAIDNTSISLASSVDTLTVLLDKGILKVSDITLEDRSRLLKELGFSDAKVAEELAMGLGDESFSSMSEGYDTETAIYSTFKDIDAVVNLYPNEEMVSAAKRALELRASMPISRRGGTSIGVARARDISNGRRLPPETWKRMYSYFSRHEVDKQATGFYPQEEGYPSKGAIAWGLFGGDAAYEKSKQIVEKLEKLVEP